jgi:hypothetical protein
VLEQFAVGRRVAFDPAKGRLWVVCPRCARWNLTPIEERWEVQEECERLFRGTKLRYSTEQIGLARMGDGLELVRVGEPLRPEMAAWRYGQVYGRRMRKQIAIGVGTLAVAATYVALPHAAIALGAIGVPPRRNRGLRRGGDSSAPEPGNRPPQNGECGGGAPGTGG